MEELEKVGLSLENFMKDGEQEGSKIFMSEEEALEVLSKSDLDDFAKQTAMNLYSSVIRIATDSANLQQRFVQLQDTYNNLLKQVDTLHDSARVNRNNLFQS